MSNVRTAKKDRQLNNGWLIIRLVKNLTTIGYEKFAGIRRVVLACGFVDLRKGIDGLAQIVGARYDLNPCKRQIIRLPK